MTRVRVGTLKSPTPRQGRDLAYATAKSMQPGDRKVIRYEEKDIKKQRWQYNNLFGHRREGRLHPDMVISKKGHAIYLEIPADTSEHIR